MKPKKDIYNYEYKYRRAIDNLEKAGISQKNKNLISEFDKVCSVEGLSKPRKIKVIGTLVLVAKNYIKNDFDKATKEDLIDAVLKLDSREDISVWTKASYKAILKKFYKWLVYRDNYREEQGHPEIIRWLKTNIGKKDQPKVQASDILTEKEINKLIEVTEHPRDKAFISMLYELGARIGEIGILKIKDISRDKYSFIVDLSGKTGHRTPRIVESDPYLTAWLNAHPLKSDPNAPLWIMIGDRNKNKRMEYRTFRALVLRVAKRAKIRKRIYPHLFRHTRVTHLLANKQINESQAKVYFGWTPDSKILSTYSHLVSQDVNNTMLEIHGIKTQENKKEPRVKQCPRCKTIVHKDDLFCGKCSCVLDVNTAIKLDEQRKDVDEIGTDLIAKDPEFQEILLKKVIEKGLGKKLIETYLKARSAQR